MNIEVKTKYLTFGVRIPRALVSYAMYLLLQYLNQHLHIIAK